LGSPGLETHIWLPSDLKPDLSITHNMRIYVFVCVCVCMSIRCAFCDKSFNEEKELFEHIDKTHSTNSIVRYIKQAAKVKERTKIIKHVAASIDNQPIIDELFKKIRQLELKIVELEARPSTTKYILKQELPTVPWGYDADKKMSEAQIWDGHNPSFSDDKIRIQGYGTDHAALISELKSIFVEKKKGKKKKKG